MTFSQNFTQQYCSRTTTKSLNRVDIYDISLYNFTNISGKEEPHMKHVIKSFKLFSTNNMMMCMYTKGSSPDLADA